MSRRWSMHMLESILIAGMLVVGLSAAARAQSMDDLIAQLVQLHGQGKYAEALEPAEKALALAERQLGKEHSQTLLIVDVLGRLYVKQGRYAEAEPLHKRTLEANERTLGKEHASTLTSTNALAELYYVQGRHAEADRLFSYVLATRERVLGKEDASTLQSVNNLAVLYREQGRYGEAELLMKRALDAQERVFGPEAHNTLASIGNLAALYQELGRYADAEPLLKRALEAKERAHGREHPDTLIGINNLALLYTAQGRYGEARPLFRHALETRERLLGREHPDTLISVSNLAGLHTDQGLHAEAEALYARVLEARERMLGKEHGDTITSINNLAYVYQHQGRYREAELLYKRALETNERVRGKEHPQTMISLGNLASLYYDQGHYGEAELLYRRALEIRERVLGREHPATLGSVNGLALMCQDQGRYREAEALFGRALEAQQRALGKEHPDTLVTLSNLAVLYHDQSRYGEAESLLRRTLEVRERTLGREHPTTIGSVNNLAALYDTQHRYREAEALYKRAWKTYERTLGADHPLTLTSANNLAVLYDYEKRHDEAEPLLKRTLEARKRVLGEEHPSTLSSATNLALVYDALGRHGEAEVLLKNALEAGERVLGKDHPLALTTLGNLGLLYRTRGRHDEAEPLLKRVLEARERVLGKGHPHVALTLDGLSALYFARGDWNRAVELRRRSTAVIIERMQLGARAGEALAGKQKSEVAQLGSYFSGLVKAAARLAVKDYPLEGEAAREMFGIAQWALSSEAGQSLAQMASRGAKRDPALAALVRERQDLVAEWQRRDALNNAALAQAPHKRNAEGEAENMARLSAIGERVAEIDKLLASSFPDYAALASPAPLSIEEVQAALGEDEALVLFLDTKEEKPVSEETFIWIVTKADMRWMRSDLGREALGREVQALRCGLDAAAWGSPRCSELTGQSYTYADHGTGKPLPFDHGRAYKLYKALFGQGEDLIKGKHLLLVPAGPLTQLPFQVLVTSPPAGADHRAVAWLARHHALTVLPAVSSLKALRRVGRPSAASRPFIGFGNPLLDGDGKHDQSADLARRKQHCRGPASQAAAAALSRSGSGVMPVDTQGRVVEPLQIRMLVPLPETADELCEVARDLNADTTDVLLGARATEHEVKALSESGRLAQYRVVHFATHGAVAGELAGTAEPGLILTPPAVASPEDDGYLSSSEIAALKLDADWVILSACNTAAGEAANAEALSGLARAFIYAQTRALLVSHWAVDSEATVRLVVSAMRQMARDGNVGRAEAVRAAMLTLVDKGELHQAHPAYWAPFVVVGDGAR